MLESAMFIGSLHSIVSELQMDRFALVTRERAQPLKGNRNLQRLHQRSLQVEEYQMSRFCPLWTPTQ